MLGALQFVLFGEVAFDHIVSCVESDACNKAAQASPLDTSCLVDDLPLLRGEIDESRLPGWHDLRHAPTGQVFSHVPNTSIALNED